MTRIAHLSRTTRIALGVLLFGAAVACTLNLDVPHTEVIEVDANGTALNKIQAIDLSSNATIQAHRANIQSLNLNTAKLTITAIDATNQWATVTGTVALRPAGITDASQDIPVGALTNFAITLNNTITLTGTAALDAFVLSTIKGSGQFQIVINGSTTGGQVGKFTVTAVLDLAMEYTT